MIAALRSLLLIFLLCPAWPLLAHAAVDDEDINISLNIDGDNVRMEVELDFESVRERWLAAGGKDTGGIVGWFAPPMLIQPSLASKAW